ncbi:MAG: hypothetical protein ACM32E_18785, partial [Gemmatimonadota bacterium]
AGAGTAGAGAADAGAAAPDAGAGAADAGAAARLRPGGGLAAAAAPAVSVVAAEGSGDDTIARLAGQLPGLRLVVTADRELRRRCEAAGAAVTGPSWLLSQF